MYETLTVEKVIKILTGIFRAFKILFGKY